MLISAVETGQMSAVEARQTSSAETRQMSTVATGQCPSATASADISISIQNEQSAYHKGCDSSRLDSKIPGRYITLGSRVMISKGYVSGLTVTVLSDWLESRHIVVRLQKDERASGKYNGIY